MNVYKDIQLTPTPPTIGTNFESLSKTCFFNRKVTVKWLCFKTFVFAKDVEVPKEVHIFNIHIYSYGSVTIHVCTELAMACDIELPYSKYNSISLPVFDPCGENTNLRKEIASSLSEISWSTICYSLTTLTSGHICQMYHSTSAFQPQTATMTMEDYGKGAQEHVIIHQLTQNLSTLPISMHRSFPLC